MRGNSRGLTLRWRGRALEELVKPDEAFSVLPTSRRPSPHPDIVWYLNGKIALLAMFTFDVKNL